MSSVLRWARGVAGRSCAARRLPPALRPRAALPSLPCRPLSHNLYRNYATQHSRQEKTQRTERLDPLLQRLDEDVRRYGRLNRRDLDEVFERIRIKSSVSSSQSLLVIRCCGGLVPEETPAERTRLVDQIWRIFAERKIPMDVSHYNALLGVYVENEHDFSSRGLLEEMEKRGIEPNRVTYQRIMWHHCQRGDVEGASKILEVMREKNMPLTENVLNALVLGHVRQNNEEGARSVLAAMSAAGLAPSAETYGILMGAAARQGDLEKINEIIKECQTQEIYLTDKELLGVIEELAVGGHPQHIDAILDQTQKNSGYNQEAINLILRLVNKKCEAAALRVLKTLTKSANQSANETPAYQSAFYIRHLIKAGVSDETVLAQCKELTEAGLAPKSYYIAAEEAHRRGNVEIALKIMKAIRDAGEPVRQHYFWPTLITSHQKGGKQGVLKVVDQIISDFEINPSIETLREYIIPSLIKDKSTKIIDTLRERGVMLNSSVRSTLMYLINENRLKEAADLVTVYGTKTPLRMLTRSLPQALNVSKDVDSFIQIVSLAYSDDSVNKIPQPEDVEEPAEEKQIGREALGRLIMGLLRYDFPLSQILQKLHENGLGITNEWANKIQGRIGDNISPDVNEYLSKMTSEDLKPLEHERGPIPNVRRTPQQLITLIGNHEGKGENVTGLKKQLLQAYIRAKDSEKVEELLTKLDSSDFVVTTGTKCQLMEMYTNLNNLDRALMYKKEILENEPDCIIDSEKVLRLALLLVKEGRAPEAIELLKQQNPGEVSKEASFYQTSLCWQILNFFAEQGDVDKVKLMFDTVIENKFCEPANIVLSSLVKVHAVKGDTKAALDQFEKCCNTYKTTPWKNELSKKLIMEEDANGLQKLTDLSTVIHGEVNSLYDLVFVFIECGRLKQARRILETPGMRSKNQRFNIVCERYSQEGKVECLEGLLEATRELSHIDRSEVFQQLLNNYIQAENIEKSLGLWTLLQEENVPPTDKFLSKLAQFLKSKKQPVPFIVPVTKGNVAAAEKPSTKPVITNKNAADVIENHLRNGNIEEAVLELKGLIEKRKFYRLTVRLVLNKLAEKGMLQQLEEVGLLLTPEQQKSVRFNTKKCNALINGGLTQGFLIELEDFVKSPRPVEDLEAKLPMGGVLALLDTEDTYDRVKSISETMAGYGSLSQMSAIWSHCIITKNIDEAQKIWDKYLVNSDYLKFQSILREARSKKDVAILEILTSFIRKNSNSTPKTLGMVVSCELEILVHLNKAEEARARLDALLKEGAQLEDFDRRSLVNLKVAIERSGGKFDYIIPPRKQEPIMN